MAMTSTIKGYKNCKMCGNLFAYKSPKKEYCDDCRKEYMRIAARKRYSPDGTKIGYNQKGIHNNHWVNGIGIYRQYCKDSCERCSSIVNLCVHHRDRNRTNNVPENLETLCKSCHQKEHEVHKNFTKGIVRSLENKNPESNR